MDVFYERVCEATLIGPLGLKLNAGFIPFVVFSVLVTEPGTASRVVSLLALGLLLLNLAATVLLMALCRRWRERSSAF